MRDFEILERVKLICDEKAKKFQEYSDHLKELSDRHKSPLLNSRVWHLFFDFQIEMLKANQEEVAADDEGKEYIATKGVSKAIIADAPYRKPNLYFYPQDISEAQEGDIWHDYEGRPHFCLGGGLVEKRSFPPSALGWNEGNKFRPSRA